MRNIILISALIAASSGVCMAQDSPGEIVVTGSRVLGDEYSSIPATSIEKRAEGQYLDADLVPKVSSSAVTMAVSSTSRTWRRSGRVSARRLRAAADYGR